MFNSSAPIKKSNKILQATGILAALCLALVLTYFYLASVVRPLPHHPVFDHEGVLVLAHRGGRGLWPENTLYAFRRAAQLGADVLDMDIHALKDGTLVVIHDDTVDRTTDGSGNVQDYTLTGLQKLDAGYRWTADDGKSYPYRGQGIRIPTLQEVFLEFPGRRMNIEIKQPQPGTYDDLCHMLGEHDLSNSVVIAAFSTDVIQAFRRACPGVATAAATGEALPYYILSVLSLGKAYHPASETLQLPGFRNGKLLLTGSFMRTAHAYNMQVYAWTIDDITEMQSLIQAGVNGIITDYPDRLLKVLGRSEVKREE